MFGAGPSLAPFSYMKAIIFVLFTLTLLASEHTFAAPWRNCRPEERLPGKRCADEWAHKDEGGADVKNTAIDEEIDHGGEEEKTSHP